MTRVFVSIPVNNARDLEPLVRDLSQVRGVRITPAYQFHITLCFIGEIADDKLETIYQIVDAAVQGVKPGRIDLKGAGCFPNPKRASVVWAGLVSEVPLERISVEITSRLKAAGIPFDEKPFKPHITLGRVSGNPDLTVLMNKYRTTEFATFVSHNVLVMKSELRPEGAKHTILHASYFD